MACAHLRAVLSDPGTIPLPQTRLDFSDIHSGEIGKKSNFLSWSFLYKSLILGLDREDWTVCTRCETYRPPRAHHCRICKRCIRRMDHHCPWINNCVGERNQKFFLQFLIYVGMLSTYAVTLVVLSWWYDCPECTTENIIQQTRV